MGGKDEHEGDGGKLVRQTDPLFLTVWCPHSLFTPTSPSSVVIVGGGGQVLVPTQFPSREEKNGLRFPFSPYPPHQAGRPGVCVR